MQKVQLCLSREQKRNESSLDLSQEERFFKAIKYQLYSKKKRNRHIMPQLQPNSSCLQIPSFTQSVQLKNNGSSHSINNTARNPIISTIWETNKNPYTASIAPILNKPNSTQIMSLPNQKQRVLKNSKGESIVEPYFPIQKKELFMESRSQHLFYEYQSEKNSESTSKERDFKLKTQCIQSMDKIPGIQSARTASTIQSENNTSFSAQLYFPQDSQIKSEQYPQRVLSRQSDSNLYSCSQNLKIFIKKEESSKNEDSKENESNYPLKNTLIESISPRESRHERKESLQIMNETRLLEERRGILNNKLFQSEIFSQKEGLIKQGKTLQKTNPQSLKQSFTNKKVGSHSMKCVQTPEVEEDQKDSMKKKNKLRERIDKVMNFSLVERMANIVKEVRQPFIPKAPSILKLPSLPIKPNLGICSDFLKKKQVHFDIYEGQEEETEVIFNEVKNDKMNEKKEIL